VNSCSRESQVSKGKNLGTLDHGEQAETVSGRKKGVTIVLPAGAYGKKLEGAGKEERKNYWGE